jgi:hypothetical protein
MNATRHRCPLCDWYHEEPIATVSADALASVFGPGIMAQIAINRRAERIEELLHKHLKTHSLVEWVQKVSSLQWELNQLKATFL